MRGENGRRKLGGEREAGKGRGRKAGRNKGKPTEGRDLCTARFFLYSQQESFPWRNGITFMDWRVCLCVC